jgi:AraC-like DNA-binding protein
MSIINIIILAGIIQGFFISLLFYLKKNILFNKLFALILFTISLALLVAYLQNVLDYKAYPFLIKLSIPLPLVFIPALLVYLKKLTGTYQKNKKTNFLLFLPLFLIIIYNLPFYFGSNELKIEHFTRCDINGSPSLSDSLEDIFVELTVTFISFLAVIEAGIYRRRVKQVFSNLSKAKIGWIRFLAGTMFTLTFFALILTIGRLFSDKVPVELNFITAMGSTAAIFYIGYYLLIHPDAFSEVSTALTSINERNNNGKEPSVESKDAIYLDSEIKIIHCLETEKLYLNPELTLADLAGEIDLPPYLTSKVINQNLDTNFYSLITQYRLQHVKRELLKESGESIIEIAYRSGFNSKTNFYESFKKETGLSPSEFIKKNKSAIMSA